MTASPLPRFLPGDDAVVGTSRLQRRLHLLMLSDVCHPRINGVSTSIETFGAALGRLGFRITLIAPEYPGAGNPIDAPVEVIRIPSRQVPLDPEDRLMSWNELSRLDRRLADADFDLVHVQTPFAAHYAGLRLARRMKLPCLATYHTHFEEYLSHYVRFLPRGLLRLGARRLARHQCNALDAVVVPSQPMAQTLHGYGVRSPLHVIPTGLPASQFVRGNGKRFREVWGIAPTRKVALFVGRAAFEKNIGFLLEMTKIARRREPELMLVVAGEGPALPALRELASSLGISDHVRFVGYLPRNGGLRDCYAAANVFVFSSKTETQGLVLLEALAVGLPVLALPALGAAEIVAPERGTMAAVDDPAGFAAQLCDLLASPQRLAKLGQDALGHAACWSADAQAARLAVLYRHLLQAPFAAGDVQVQPASG